MLRVLKMIFLVFLAGCSLKTAPNVLDQQEVLRLIDEGTLYLRSRDLDNAEASFRVASEIAETAAVLDGLGCVAFLRSNFKDAEEYFWRAYEVDATYNNSLGNLALLYETEGKKDKAKELYERALNEDPRNFRTRNNYAAFLSGANNGAVKGQAKRELLKAKMLANDPLILDNIEKINMNKESYGLD